MFEKEAEEYYNGQYDAWLEGEESYALEEEIERAFKDGAEFGYNKAKVEVEEEKCELLGIIQDKDKAIQELKKKIAELKKHNSDEKCLERLAKKGYIKFSVKANEWHFVSKEGFPNKDDIYLIIRRDGLHLGDYCCGGDGDIDCQSWCDYPSEEEIQDDSVIAWKEIVLPKENE